MKYDVYKSVDICIGMMPTRLVLMGFSSSKEERLRNDYAAFTFPGSENIPYLTIDIEHGDTFNRVEKGEWLVRSSISSGKIKFTSYYEQGWFDLNSMQGELVMRPEGDPENFLRVIYAWRCLEQGALLLHASGVIRNGKGYCQ